MPRKAATVAAAPTGAKAIYKVLTPVQHNLEDYEVGDPIELTEAEAAPLEGVNAIEFLSAGEDLAPTE